MWTIPSGQKETPDSTEESRWASQLLEVWKRSNPQLLLTDTLSVAKAFLSTWGCSWCFVWSTSKGNRFFHKAIGIPALNFSSGSIEKSGDSKINHLDIAPQRWIFIVNFCHPVALSRVEKKLSTSSSQSSTLLTDSLPIALHLWAFQSMALPHAKHAVTAPRIRKTPFREASNFNWYKGRSVLCYMYLYCICIYTAVWCNVS